MVQVCWREHPTQWFGWEAESCWCWWPIQSQHRTWLSNGYHNFWETIWGQNFYGTCAYVESLEVLRWEEELAPHLPRWLCFSFVDPFPKNLQKTSTGWWKCETVLGTLPELLRMVQVTPILQPCQQLGQHGSPIAVWWWCASISKQRMWFNVNSCMVQRPVNTKFIQVPVLPDHSFFWTWGVCLHIQWLDDGSFRANQDDGHPKVGTGTWLSMVGKRLQFHVVKFAGRSQVGEPTLR